MRNKLYAGFLLALLTALLLFAPVKRLLVQGGYMAYENTGNEKTADAENRAAYVRAYLEDTYTNYFPFYSAVVRLHDRLHQQVDEPVSGYLMTLAARNRPAPTESRPDEGKTAEPKEMGVTIVSRTARYLNATDTHRNYLFTLEFSDGRTEQFLDRVVALPEDEKEERLNNSIRHLQRICSYKTDRVNYYLYVGSRLQDMDYLSDYLPTEESSWGDLSRLLEALPENVRYDRLKFADGADRLQYIYRTDHHWTAAGADVGYREILAMMREDTPEIGEPRTGTVHTVDRLPFGGSFARLSNYTAIRDTLSFTAYDLPPYTTEGNGMPLADAMAYYLSDAPDTISYEAFFPYFHRIDCPDNHTGRNLLILGDSFTRAISEPLAAHFDHTYVIYPGAAADLNRYINRFGVTDVLILMYSDRLLYTIYDEIDWNRFLTRGGN